MMSSRSVFFVMSFITRLVVAQMQKPVVQGSDWLPERPNLYFTDTNGEAERYSGDMVVRVNGVNPDVLSSDQRANFQVHVGFYSECSTERIDANVAEAYNGAYNTVNWVNEGFYADGWVGLKFHVGANSWPLDRPNGDPYPDTYPSHFEVELGSEDSHAMYRYTFWVRIADCVSANASCENVVQIPRYDDAWLQENFRPDAGLTLGLGVLTEPPVDPSLCSDDDPHDNNQDSTSHSDSQSNLADLDDSNSAVPDNDNSSDIEPQNNVPDNDNSSDITEPQNNVPDNDNSSDITEDSAAEPDNSDNSEPAAPVPLEEATNLTCEAGQGTLCSFAWLTNTRNQARDWSAVPDYTWTARHAEPAGVVATIAGSLLISEKDLAWVEQWQSSLETSLEETLLPPQSPTSVCDSGSRVLLERGANLVNNEVLVDYVVLIAESPSNSGTASPACIRWVQAEVIRLAAGTPDSFVARLNTQIPGSPARSSSGAPVSSEGVFFFVSYVGTYRLVERMAETYPNGADTDSTVVGATMLATVVVLLILLLVFRHMYNAPYKPSGPVGRANSGGREKETESLVGNHRDPQDPVIKTRDHAHAHAHGGDKKFRREKERRQQKKVPPRSGMERGREERGREPRSRSSRVSECEVLAVFQEDETVYSEESKKKRRHSAKRSRRVSRRRDLSE